MTFASGRSSSCGAQVIWLRLRALVYPNSWCQIEAEGPIWYQFGTMEGEKIHRRGRKWLRCGNLWEICKEKEGMAEERGAAAKLH
jgi:hypothetical protein